VVIRHRTRRARAPHRRARAHTVPLKKKNIPHARVSVTPAIALDARAVHAGPSRANTPDPRDVTAVEGIHRPAVRRTHDAHPIRTLETLVANAGEATTRAAVAEIVKDIVWNGVARAGA